MASEQAILGAWSALRGAGIVPPWKTEADFADALPTWLRLLERLTDAQLLEALDAHMRRSEWWPRPSQLLELAPRPKAERQAEDDWPGRLWMQVQPPGRRLALLDQAAAEVREKPACGRSPDQRCCVTCDPCCSATIARADELAEDHLEQQETAA